jgi:Ca2+-binding RTX toxin-like protein
VPQYPDVISVAALDGDNGFVINGAAPGQVSGNKVASADVNGDGLTDLIIAAYNASTGAALSGATYVVFGRASGFGPSFNLADVDGTNGFRIDGEQAFDFLGQALASAGDLNGDGFDDIILGLQTRTDPEVSLRATYVVFGKSGGFGSELDLGALDGTNGFLVEAESAGDLAGTAVAGAGDINGDGFDDLIIGAFAADPNGPSSGASYVVFGRASGFPASFNVAALNGVDGFRISGASAGAYSGFTLSGAGDVNGDGFDDFAIASYGARTVHVVFGKAGAFPADLNLSTLNGSNGFRLDPEVFNDALGRSISAAGDVNADGYADLIVGAPNAGPSGNAPGASYVVFGRAGGFPAVVNLSTLNGSAGFQISGEALGDNSGGAVSGAGDVNGDGFDDLLVGARGADVAGVYSGASYVIFGRAGGFPADFNLSALDGTNGYQINGASVDDGSGNAVSAAGDVNGDGFADILIAASRGNPNGAGVSYVLFGGPPATAVERTGSEIANRIFGGVGDDRLSGLDGADTLLAGDGADTALGGGGADSLLGGVDDDSLSGGSGADQLFGDVGDDTAQGGGGDDDLRGGADDDVLSGGVGSDQLLGEGGDDALSGGGGTDRLDGGTGDDELDGGSGADRLVGGLGNDVLNGGSGLDTADYGAANAALVVNLATFGWQNTGGGGFDSVWNVEGLIGSRFGDTLTGGIFDDQLRGGLGADVLSGAEGDDTLVGGRGGDSLTGGVGNDVFVYVAVNESQGTGANADRISGLASGDAIDLSSVDADSLAGGNQAFTLASGFTGVAGQLVLTFQGASNRTLLRGDVNGDGVADLSVILEGGDFTGFTGLVL